MDYVSQTIVFLLALLGSFFNCAKQDDSGKKIYWRSIVPVPSRAGAIILVLLSTSFGISLVSTLNEKDDAREDLYSANKSADELRSTLAELSGKNDNLLLELKSATKKIDLLFSSPKDVDSKLPLESIDDLQTRLEESEAARLELEKLGFVPRPNGPAGCPEYEGSRARSRIYQGAAFQSQGTAKIVLENTGLHSLLVSLYHPNERFPGVTAFSQWSVEPGVQVFLGSNFYGGDWGIQIDSSCISYLGEVSQWKQFDGEMVFYLRR
ncbi:MAG TPA: hypothetical protein VN285_08075 [Candidatus Deferrimicrobium sp.]|nr:hypothetical protein [Candidatus Deferrimicrobium sp.]